MRFLSQIFHKVDERRKQAIICAQRSASQRLSELIMKEAGRCHLLRPRFLRCQYLPQSPLRHLCDMEVRRGRQDSAFNQPRD